MTIWTNPTIRVYVNGVLWTGYIDWAVEWGQSRNSTWELCSPGTGSVTFIATTTASIPIKYHDVIRMEVDDNAGGWTTFATAWVDSIDIGFRDIGPAGQVVEMRCTLVGATSSLINATWVSSGATQSTAAAIAELMTYVGDLSWNEVDPTLTWSNVPASWTWSSLNNANTAMLNGYSIIDNSAGGYQVQIPAGERNAWDDLQQLVIASHGTVFEKPDGKISIVIGVSAWGVLTQVDLFANTLGKGITATLGGSDVRNSWTVTYNGGTYATSDASSVYTYGEQTAAVSTFLTSSLDAATVGQTGQKGMAYPVTYINQCDIDLLNPNVADVTRDWLRTIDVFGFINPVNFSDVPSPLPRGYELLLGYRRNINRNTYGLTMQLCPYTWYYNHDTWAQVPYSYTWASYLAAFPTRKWSDV